MSQGTTSGLFLHEILLSISDSLAEAQAQLRNVEPYDAFGRPNTLYQIPYLDFNLQVSSEVETVTSNTPQSVPSAVNLKVLNLQGTQKVSVPTPQRVLFRPVSPSTSSSTSSSQIVSTISGRFVATVPNEGIPQIIIETRTEKLTELNQTVKYKLIVKLGNAAGEVLQNAKVELNFDQLKSNGVNGVNISPPLFNISENNTDVNGIANFEITLNATDYTSRYIFMFLLNVGTSNKIISISKS